MDLLTEDELRFWHAWKHASETVRARVAEDISAATGLSDADFGILTRLVDLGEGSQGGGSLRQNELAASLGWHRSRLSHQLTRMEQRDLIRRDPADGGVVVTITDRGTADVAAARPVHAAAVREHLLDFVPPRQAGEIAALLGVIADR
ncbi:MarR family winged helix-turn-helix transcriptional regulator [Kutzneria sp. CA-103260]|uniref:MarR family winged helix-turn-helix transcriptional regulator n=1 Tax=Kutzneria sp. CA-103260 TaxID=2802641 RepID=UPI001BA9245E|nr:MarR family transcriptional regulator [Kutzneria sp. CA-103260]QUQ65983.1 transcriptional regulator [Kutzneria sp. CA-103260]